MPKIEGKDRPMVQYDFEATFDLTHYIQKEGISRSYGMAAANLTKIHLTKNCGGDYIDVNWEKSVSSRNWIEVQISGEITGIGYGEEDQQTVANEIYGVFDDVADDIDAKKIRNRSVKVSDLTPSGTITLNEDEKEERDNIFGPPLNELL